MNYRIDDYNKQILKPMIKRFGECKAQEELFKHNILSDLLFMGYTKPTKLQKFKYKLQDWKQRFSDIWFILTGGTMYRDE